MAIKMKFIGVGRQYVAGYPRTDIEVETKQKADWLVATGCYAYADAGADDQGEANDVADADISDEVNDE